MPEFSVDQIFDQARKISRIVDVLMYCLQTLTCGLTSQRRGFCRIFSSSSMRLLTVSRCIELKIEASSRDMGSEWRGNVCTSGSDFLRCTGVATGIFCGHNKIPMIYSILYFYLFNNKVTLNTLRVGWRIYLILGFP